MFLDVNEYLYLSDRVDFDADLAPDYDSLVLLLLRGRLLQSLLRRRRRANEPDRQEALRLSLGLRAFFVEEARVDLKEVLTEGPLVVSVDEGRLMKDKGVGHLLAGRVLVQRRVRTYERVFVNVTVIGHREGRHCLVVHCPLGDLLVVQGCHRHDVRPLTDFCEVASALGGGQPGRHSDAIVRPGIQVSNDASVRFALVNLSELLNTADFDAYAVLKDVLDLGGTEGELGAVLAEVLPLQFDRS